MMITNKSSKFLRLIGILLVIASHYAGWMYVEPLQPKLKEWVSGLGPYGVDIFFLMSGYGLYKSAKKDSKVGKSFIIKRITGAYMPYFLVSLLIHLKEGNLPEFSPADWWKLLTGYDFWFMNILFIFYILFIIIWQFKPEIIRLVLITIATVATMVVMSGLGRQDFWIISNPAFLVGIYAAALEKNNKKKKKDREGKTVPKIPMLVGIASLVLMVIMTKGILGNWDFGENTILYNEIIINILFTGIILGIAYYIPQWKYLPVHIGSSSLFIYMIHQWVFWQLTVPFANMEYRKMAIIIGVITLIIGVVLGTVYQAMSKKIYGLLKV